MADWVWPQAVILSVVDGDTLTARLVRDVGFGSTITHTRRLRLLRINAAPRSTDLGRQAADFTRAWTTDRPLVVVTSKPYKYGGSDEGGQYMAEVVDAGSGQSLSDMLVGAGLAAYWDGRGPRPLGVPRIE